MLFLISNFCLKYLFWIFIVYLDKYVNFEGKCIYEEYNVLQQLVFMLSYFCIFHFYGH